MNNRLKIQITPRQKDVIAQGLCNGGRFDLAARFIEWDNGAAPHDIYLDLSETREILSVVAGQDLGCAAIALNTFFQALVVQERGVVSAILDTATDTNLCRRAAVLEAIRHAEFTADDLKRAQELADSRGCDRLKASVRILCNALRYND
jgi:hypothetical protein